MVYVQFEILKLIKWPLQQYQVNFIHQSWGVPLSNSSDFYLLQLILHAAKQCVTGNKWYCIRTIFIICSNSYSLLYLTPHIIINFSLNINSIIQLIIILDYNLVHLSSIGIFSFMPFNSFFLSVKRVHGQTVILFFFPGIFLNSFL